MYSVLIVDDEAPVRQMLSIFLQSQGYHVWEAEDGLAGADLFEEKQPTIVLTDVRMPRLNGLDLTRRVRVADPTASVILMTGHGGEETAIEALRAGATNYLKKPLDIAELGEMLRRQIDLIESRLARAIRPGELDYEERTLVIDNDLEHVAAVIDYLTASAHIFFNRADINYIKLGLDEMIRNAIEHGNFAISYQEKSAALDAGTWDALLQQRACHPEYSRRRVRIRLRLSPREFRCTVEDEGAGFDWRSLPDPQNPENLLHSHGRGILLTTFYYDRVEYNDKGNAVTLVKSVSAPQAAEVAAAPETVCADNRA